MRHPNPHLAKKSRNYTVDEICRLYVIHRNTVREWIRRGLPICDPTRPMLIHGTDLAAFLEARRQKNRVKCPVGHIYCVRCRAAKRPAGRMADYMPRSPLVGNLVGICPDCMTLMFRRVALNKLDSIRG